MSTRQAQQRRPNDPASIEAPDAVRAFLEALALKTPQFNVKLDPPAQQGGEWFLDIHDGDFDLQVAWRPARGFGLFTAPDEGYGSSPTEVFADPRQALLRVIQVHARWTVEGQVCPARMGDLRELLGKPQVEMARVLEMSQGAVSQFEKRSDVKLQTLDAYVNAMGGRLELRVHLPGIDVAVVMPPASPTTERVVRA